MLENTVDERKKPKNRLWTKVEHMSDSGPEGAALRTSSRNSWRRGNNRTNDGQFRKNFDIMAVCDMKRCAKAEEAEDIELFARFYWLGDILGCLQNRLDREGTLAH